MVDAVRHGLSNPEIAARRRISLDAVKFHVANAPRKLDLAGSWRVATLERRGAGHGSFFKGGQDG